MTATDLDMRHLAGPHSRPTENVALPGIVLLYLIATILPIAINAGPIVLSLQRILLLIMIVPLMVRILSGKCGGIIAPDILFPLHILWAAVALYVNNPDRVIQQVGSVGLEFLGGYVVGRACIRTPEQFRALARTLMVIILVMLPLTLFETLTGRPLIIEMIRKIPGVFSMAGISNDIRLGLGRVQMAFTHPIHFGLFCATILPLVFVALKDQMSDGKRFLVSAIVLGSGFLALSSGAFLALLLQCGLIVWAVAFNKMERRWALLVALFALAYVVIDLLSNRTPFQVFMSYATFSAHTAYWRSIILDWGIANVVGSAEKGVTGHPWFGIGLNDWVRPVYMYSGSMDNFWLVMAVRYGLPGFLLLAAGYVLGMIRVMRRDFTADPELANIRRSWVFTFMGMTFTLATVHIWSTVYSYVFFMYGAGMWLIWMPPRTAGTAPQTEAAQQPRGPRFSRFSGPPPETLAAPPGGAVHSRPAARGERLRRNRPLPSR